MPRRVRPCARANLDVAQSGGRCRNCAGDYGPYTTMYNRFKKYIIAATKPAFWPALRRGVVPAVEHIDAIESLKPRTLIDVGANKGQFSVVARYLFPKVVIHAFEPLECD